MGSEDCLMNAIESGRRRLLKLQSEFMEMEMLCSALFCSVLFCSVCFMREKCWRAEKSETVQDRTRIAS